MYLTTYAELTAYLESVSVACRQQRRDDFPAQEFAVKLAARLQTFKAECEKSGFERPLERFSILGLAGDGLTQCSFGVLKHELEELLAAANRETARRKFFVLTLSEAAHFNKKYPFGEAVYNAFGSSVHDAREAWNCYALNRYTASVFHCMRVLEKGLHALVHHLNSNHSAGIVFSGTVEETNWGNIITEIQLAIENPRRLARLNPFPDKDQMRFYSQISLEFEYFKNAWRDDVSHSRKSYDEPSAKSVLEHVERFMRQLVKGGVKE